MPERPDPTPDPPSRLEDIRRSEYHITWQEGTYLRDVAAAYQTPNRYHNLRTYFTPSGIHVMRRTETEPSWELGLSLSGYGYEGDVQPVPEADLSARGNGIEYRRGNEGGGASLLTEWYVNEEGGLKQGFTLNAPQGKQMDAAHSELVLELTLSGDLKPHLVENVGVTGVLSDLLELDNPRIAKLIADLDSKAAASS